MQEKKVHKLIIDRQFQQLIPPLQKNEFEQLEKNILENGCREPICIFKNTIIDGHNRYSICTKHNIPFYVQDIDFVSREEIIIWICANQLGRRNISSETKKYLIGKRYEAEKIIQNHKNSLGINQYHETTQLPPLKDGFKGRNKTAKRLGQVYNISHSTVKVYSKFAQSIDYISKQDSEFCDEVLKGNVKLTKQDVSDILSAPNKISSVKKRIVDNLNEKNIPKKVTVKDMPTFDPDGEITSLVFTIPSWVGSIERVFNKQDFTIVSQDAMNKLKVELQKMKDIVEIMLLTMEEINDR